MLHVLHSYRTLHSRNNISRKPVLSTQVKSALHMWSLGDPLANRHFFNSKKSSLQEAESDRALYWNVYSIVCHDREVSYSSHRVLLKGAQKITVMVLRQRRMQYRFRMLFHSQAIESHWYLSYVPSIKSNTLGKKLAEEQCLWFSWAQGNLIVPERPEKPSTWTDEDLNMEFQLNPYPVDWLVLFQFTVKFSVSLRMLVCPRLGYVRFVSLAVSIF